MAGRGHDVVLFGRSNPGFDLLIHGAEWELKTLRASSINAVRRNISNARRQSSHIIIDGRLAGLRVATALRAIRASKHAGRTVGLKTVWFECVDGSPWLRADEKALC